MARTAEDDFMQAFAFYLIDVSPSLRPPFFALGGELSFAGTPFGFQTCTAPEITADVAEIAQVNDMYKSYYYTGASVSSLTLTRGVMPKDSTMFRWLIRS